MTHAQRILLADRYLELLEEGRIEDLLPILAKAEADSELSEMIIALSRGYAEENGRDTTPAAEAGIHARLNQVVREVVGGSDPSASSDAASTSGPAEGKPFLVATRDISGKSMEQAAHDLGGTANFFDDLNRYPNHSDPRVRALHPRIYELNAERNRVPPEISSDALEHNNPLYAMAAYAEGEINHDEPTFEEILEDSGMTPEQQEYWRLEGERRASQLHND